MQKFWARMHVGHSVEFIGHSWEDGGFHVDGDGNPKSDSRGNSVAGYTVSEVTVADADRLRDAYAGDDRIGGLDEFRWWLQEEVGLSEADARSVAGRFADEVAGG